MSVRDDDGFAAAEIGAGPPWMSAEQARVFHGWREREGVTAQLVRSFGQTFVFVPSAKGFHVFTHGNFPHPAGDHGGDGQP